MKLILIASALLLTGCYQTTGSYYRPASSPGMGQQLIQLGDMFNTPQYRTHNRGRRCDVTTWGSPGAIGRTHSLYCY